MGSIWKCVAAFGVTISLKNKVSSFFLILKAQPKYVDVDIISQMLIKSHYYSTLQGIKISIFNSNKLITSIKINGPYFDYFNCPFCCTKYC